MWLSVTSLAAIDKHADKLPVLAMSLRRRKLQTMCAIGIPRDSYAYLCAAIRCSPICLCRMSSNTDRHCNLRLERVRPAP